MSAAPRGGRAARLAGWDDAGAGERGEWSKRPPTTVRERARRGRDIDTPVCTPYLVRALYGMDPRPR